MKTNTIEKLIDLEYEINFGWRIIPDDIEKMQTIFEAVDEAIEVANQYKNIKGIGYVYININVVNTSAKEDDQKYFTIDEITIL